MTISPAQCRAARALIEWSQTKLCESAGVGRATLANFEAGKSIPYERTLRDIRAALEAGGVVFIDANGNGPGARLRERE